ncbi:MAG TPA: cadherin-like domain-containing protein, partial [Burkholderiales bacterium]|nr:cadherin-like domain-containing protein [Burkholderiales bacterium]
MGKKLTTKKSAPNRRRPTVEEVEPRILYSADLSPALLQAAPVASAAEHRTLDAGGEFTATAAAQGTTTAPVTRPHEVVFVDTAVPEYQKLVDDIKANAGQTRQIDVVLIGQGSDGIAKITQTLAGMHDVSAVHIISHGADGEIQLGADTLNFDSLLKNASQIKSWSQALAPGADLLLYGCDVAEYADGKALVNALSRLTGADVAASENPTGAVAKGGDWTLEYHTGAIQTGLALSAAEEKSYDGVLLSSAQGSETRANTTTSGTQELGSNNPPRNIAMDANGNYVVVWDGNGTQTGQTDSQGIFFQRYNASGVAQGSETRVNTTTTDVQHWPAVAMDSNGNFVVTWTSANQDGSGDGIYAQRYDATGAKVGSEFKVNTTTANAQQAPVIAMSTNGFVIAWNDSAADGSGNGVFAQRYNSSGTKQGSEFQVNVTTAGDQWLDSAAMDASGNFIITFSIGDENSGGTSQDVYMRRYNSSGTALTGEVRVNTTTAGDQNYSSVIMNATGAFVITWESSDGSSDGIYAQRYDSTGTKLGSEFRVNTTTTGEQHEGVADIDDSGNFVVIWSSYGQDAANTWGVYKQEYNSDGTTDGGETRVNTTTAGDQVYASIAMDGAGDFVVGWSGDGAGDSASYSTSTSSGSGGTTVTITASGGGVFFQRYAHNQAPVLSGANNLTAINEDPSSNPGTLVSSLISGKVSDPDTGALSGIAVTLVDNTNGTWQYSTNGGSTWTAFGTPSNSAALLLAADANTYVRFVPNANWNGTVSGLTFRAWDQTSGTAGSTYDTTSNGGTTAFSSATATANITVNSVNDAPQGTNTTVTTLEDTAYTFATADFGFSDSNDSPANSLLAVKITTLPGAGSLKDNGVAVTAGQFVSATDISGGKLVFTPAANANGAGYASFTFQVQDNGGTANGGVDTDPTANTMTVNVTSVNDAPQGTNKTVTTLEDTAYTFATADFGFSDPNDSPANNLLAVKVTTVPGAGSLTDNGVAVTAGQFIAVADITGGKLKFTPGANANGAGYASFTFQVQDDGGTTNGGVDTDPTARTMTVNVTSVNDAPQGTNKTVTTLEDTAYAFATADFGFSDPNDSPANNLLAVKITTLPGAGSLKDNGVAVTAGQFVSATDISGGKLVFTPGTHAWGNNYASFTFEVQDDGGTGNGGADTDPTPRSMSVNVNQVDHAPQGTNNTVTTAENSVYTFATADFGFSDPNDSPANNLLAVKITTVPGAGSLTDNGVAVTAGQFVSATDISSGKLVFTPGANGWGNNYAAFTFQVQDDGSGGTNLDPTARSMTVNVTQVDHTPQGSSNTVTTTENGAYTFATADFGFSDPNDSPANNLLAVKITTVPGAGSLTDNGVAVTAGQFVSATDISSGKLVFTPGANGWGNNYAAFTFQVQDDGSGGTNLDPTARSMTVNVNEVDHAPQGTNNTVTTSENGVYTFATADFGFSDPNDSPGNNLLAVKITTVPGAGSLTDNGVAVTAGQFVAVADITGGKLKFTPGTNAWGNNYASFTFQVQDDGTGGTNLDPTARSTTVNVNEVDHAPQGTNNTVTTSENSAYTFASADFGFSDPNDSPANNLLAVKITTVPSAGSLTDNGVAVTAGQFVSASDITSGKLVFTPGANGWGNNYASFTFQVQDDGTGGSNLDPTARSMTVNVTQVDHAPQGTNNTVSTSENSVYTFATADFGFSDPNDTPANNLLAVKITTIPSAGSLTDNGVAVTAGQFVSASDISSGKLVFAAGTNAWGNNYASFTFQVQDDGTGGTNLDPTARSMTVNVNEVDHAPQGTSNTVTTAENSAYTFASADFGFSDANDSPANNLLAVKITTVPSAGSLTDNGVAITAGQFIAVADITGGKLKFTPGTNAWGNNYASFTFQVQDDGSGGTNLDPTARSMTVNVTEVDHAPQGTNNTVTTSENSAYTFASGDFGFSDPNDSPANSLLAVKITTVPSAGSLTDNGVAVTAGQFIAVADITGGKLKFTPGTNAWGNNSASFTFQVQDDGTGGTNLDPTARTMTVNVNEVDHAPQGASNTVSTLENSGYTFATADFGFSDPNDSPANNLLAVKITTLPGAGSLTDNGVAVTAGQFVSASDIGSGKLVFNPGANAWGNNYAAFTFQVQDDGTGGTNLDPTARSMTVNVTHVNVAPSGTSNAISMIENGTYVLQAGDFGYSDNETPADSLLAVKVTTLPGAGSLTDNGAAVTAGQFVSATDISAGKLVFTPAAFTWGSPYDSFSFQVQDNGGTSNGGVDLDPTPNTLTFNVLATNTAPTLSGANNLAAINENPSSNSGTLVSALVAGQVSDPDPGALQGIAVTAVDNSNGTWQYSTNGGASWNNFGAPSAASARLLAADANTYVRFAPNANWSGSVAAGITFCAWDQTAGSAGSTADTTVSGGSTAFSVATASAGITVNYVNQAPQGTNNTVTTLENGAYTFATADFGFSDPNDSPANNLLAVKITTVPGAGSLTDNGVAVTAGQFVSASDISGGKLVFAPSANGWGNNYAAFTFQVQDDGGTANGGVDTDPTARSMTVNVSEVDHAPQGTNNTVTTTENGAYTFATADFGFSDPNDSPANNLLAVKITTVPGAGSLTDNGVAVTAGQFVSASDISGGKLVFTPGANGWGSNYAAFTFQVQDDGTGGTNLDPSARSMTVDVTQVDHAPQGTNTTVTTTENGVYTFATTDFGFSDPNDNPANNLLAVKITTVPGAGSLTDNGVTVTAGQFVSASDISGGKLVFTPGANGWGSNYAAFTFQVQDDGTGGTNLDPSARSMTVNVTQVDHAPQGTNNSVTTSENGVYTFATADFGFSDPNDSPANSLLAVKIATIPSAGSLTDNGVAVTAGQFIAVADITGGKLKFTPGANAWGNSYASFTFQVQDDGTGGTNLDATARSMTVNVNEVDHAPQGTNNTVTTTENGVYTFATADFGFSDPNDSPANNLLAVKITTVPGAGSLTDNGVAVTAGQFVSATDISSGKLVFTPGANDWGNGYAAFTFQVQDDGTGGTSLDPSARSMAVDVTQVDHAPQGTNNTVTTTENGVYTFATADFGFSDPNDSPANNLLAVKITTVPGAGSLTDNGVTVTAGQFVSASDISGGKLVFTPGANGWGSNYAAFTFQVQDDGTGGTNLDPTARSMTVDVTQVDHAPQGTNNTVTTTENGVYTFATADFGFSDANDNPANNLLAVKITTLPGAGSLTDNGVTVTAGQFVSASDISGGKLVFTPGANGWGSNYAAFTFQVQDDG